MMMANDTLNSMLVRESRWLKRNKDKGKESDKELKYDMRRAEIFLKELSQAANSGPNSVPPKLLDEQIGGVPPSHHLHRKLYRFCQNTQDSQPQLSVQEYGVRALCRGNPMLVW